MAKRMSDAMYQLLSETADKAEQGKLSAKPYEKGFYESLADTMKILMDGRDEISDRRAAVELYTMDQRQIPALQEIIEDAKEKAFSYLDDRTKERLVERDVRDWRDAQRPDFNIKLYGINITDKAKDEAVRRYPASMREDVMQRLNAVSQEKTEEAAKDFASKILMMMDEHPELKEAMMEGMSQAMETVREQDKEKMEGEKGKTEEYDIMDDLDIQYLDYLNAESGMRGQGMPGLGQEALDFGQGMPKSEGLSQDEGPGISW